MPGRPGAQGVFGWEGAATEEHLAFPIVREQNETAFGRYLTKDLVLVYMCAIAAGDLTSRITAWPRDSLPAGNAGGLKALEALGEPADVLRQTKARTFAT